nr:uncharacterized protein LOC125631552 isoform X2 [Caretta caretta]
MPTTRRGRQTDAPVLCPRAASSTKSCTQYSVVTPLRRPLWILCWLACQLRVDRARRRKSLEKEGTEDPEAEDDSEARDACSQELFSTPEEPSQSQQSDLGKAQTGEEDPKQLCRIRKRPRRTKEDFLYEVMMHSTAEKQELKEWWDSENRDRKENAAHQKEAMERLLNLMEPPSGHAPGDTSSSNQAAPYLLSLQPLWQNFCPCAAPPHTHTPNTLSTSWLHCLPTAFQSSLLTVQD